MMSQVPRPPAQPSAQPAAQPPEAGRPGLRRPDLRRPEPRRPEAGRSAAGVSEPLLAEERPAAAGGRSMTVDRLGPAVLLIVIGLLFLSITVSLGVPGLGPTLIGLGAILVVMRSVTGRYPYAIPAGVTLAMGVFLSLHDAELLAGSTFGWFCIFVGGGFLTTYAVGFRRDLVWPVFVAVLLLLVGVIVLGLGDQWPMTRLAWLGAYWPVIILGIGIWLLVRNDLPRPIRRTVTNGGVIAIVLYAVLSLAASLASSTPFSALLSRSRLPWAAGSASTAAQERSMSVPLVPGQHLTVHNGDGRTTVRPGGGSAARVVAVGADGRVPELRLLPSASLVTIETTGVAAGVANEAIDLTIELPPGIPITIEAAAGDILVSDLRDAVSVRTTSGSIRLHQLLGEVRAVTGSGAINAVDLSHLREISTSSGDVWIDGVFAEAATVRSTSGDITVLFRPASAVRVDALSATGDVWSHGLALAQPLLERHRVGGTLNAGPALLVLQTSTGTIVLAPVHP